MGLPHTVFQISLPSHLESSTFIKKTCFLFVVGPPNSHPPTSSLHRVVMSSLPMMFHMECGCVAGVGGDRYDGKVYVL